jgi:hypothetical protein
MDTIHKYWIKFLDSHKLRGIEIEINEEQDLSEFGISLKIFNEMEITEEMNNYYPGIIVKNDKYIPVASCNYGSGDPYFINLNDGQNGKLYRIYHDEFLDDEYDKDSAIDVVLENYELLLKFKQE